VGWRRRRGVGDLVAQCFVELGRRAIVEAWPSLSDALKTGIGALVKATSIPSDPM
jgi:hypothetical protein